MSVMLAYGPTRFIIIIIIIIKHLGYVPSSAELMAVFSQETSDCVTKTLNPKPCARLMAVCSLETWDRLIFVQRALHVSSKSRSRLRFASHVTVLTVCHVLTHMSRAYRCSCLPMCIVPTSCHVLIIHHVLARFWLWPAALIIADLIDMALTASTLLGFPSAFVFLTVLGAFFACLGEAPFGGDANAPEACLMGAAKALEARFVGEAALTALDDVARRDFAGEVFFCGDFWGEVVLWMGVLTWSAL